MKDARPRTPAERTVLLTRILAVVAAVLGFAALIARYAIERKVDFTALGGGVFMLALAFTVGRRR